MVEHAVCIDMAISSVLGRMHEGADPFVRGGRSTLAASKPDNGTVQFFDLSETACLQVLPHRRAGAGIDVRHDGTSLCEFVIGQAQQRRQSIGCYITELRGVDSCNSECIECFVDHCGKNAPVARVHQLRA